MKKVAIILIAFIFSLNSFGQNKPNVLGKISNIQENDHVGKIQTSSLEFYFNNTGQGATDPKRGNSSGFYFPAGSGKSVVFADGFVWSGFIQLNDTTQELRSGGATYAPGLQAGKILQNGMVNNGSYQSPVADVASRTENRVYSIYKRWNTLSNDDLQKSNFQNDFETWPIGQGAPKNEDGTPKFKGDFTSFYVSNDMSTSRANQLYGSKPMGLEIQTTVWANDRNLGADQIIYFTKKIINKSGLPIKDFYVSIWSDQDLGDVRNDLVGVDTSLGLTFIYDGDDADSYYKIPPAHGYLLLSDVNQSSFAYYINGGPSNIADPPLGSANGTIYLNRYQRGLDAIGNPLKKSDNVTPTKFPMSGDPVAGTGDLDGLLYSKGDRRILYSFGPFQFGVGDSIEFSYASLVAQGNSRLHSITKLKSLAKEAKKIFTNSNELNNYPLNPQRTVLKSTVMDRKIQLSWEDVSTENEKLKSAGFRFEGYKIYQYKTPNERVLFDYFDLPNGVGLIQDSVVVVGGWEIQTVATGSNSGIQRSLLISTDKFRDEPLINGFEYQFGVSTVYVRPDSINGQEIWPDVLDSKTRFPLHFEVPISPILSVKPMHNNEWGNGYWYSGDTLTFSKNGIFSNSIKIIVADPNALDQSDYKIEFVNDAGTVRWKLKNLTKLTESSLHDIGFSGLLDGFWLEVGEMDPNFTDFQITKNANGVLNPPSYGAFAFSGSGFPNPGPYQTAGTGTVNGNSDRPSSNSQASGKVWGIHAYTGTGPYNDGSTTSFMARSTQYTGGLGRPNQGLRSVVPDDIEIRFTGAAETAKIYNKATDFTVPFQVWNTKGDDDPSNDFRILPGISDLGATTGNVADGIYSITKNDHVISGGDNDPITDPIYLIEPLDRTPGEQGFNDLIAKINANPDAWAAEIGWAYYSGPDEYDRMNFGSKPSVMRLVFVGLNLASISDATAFAAAVAATPYPEAGTVFKIVTSKPATPDNYVSFTTIGKSVTGSYEGENPGDFALFENYPNPFNPETKIEVNLKFDAMVNLTIYDVLGREVNVLVNDFEHAGRMTKTWDGKNNKGQSVSSGVYFYKVEIKSNNGSKLFVKTNKMILLK